MRNIKQGHATGRSAGKTKRWEWVQIGRACPSRDRPQINRSEAARSLHKSLVEGNLSHISIIDRLPVESKKAFARERGQLADLNIVGDAFAELERAVLAPDLASLLRQPAIGLNLLLGHRNDKAVDIDHLSSSSCQTRVGSRRPREHCRPMSLRLLADDHPGRAKLVGEYRKLYGEKGLAACPRNSRPPSRSHSGSGRRWPR